MKQESRGRQHWEENPGIQLVRQQVSLRLQALLGMFHIGLAGPWDADLLNP